MLQRMCEGLEKGGGATTTIGMGNGEAYQTVRERDMQLQGLFNQKNIFRFYRSKDCIKRKK